MPYVLRVSGLLGTTNGISGSMRKALLINHYRSRFTASGASCLLTPPPALKKAISTPANASERLLPQCKLRFQFLLLCWQNGNAKSLSLQKETTFL